MKKIRGLILIIVFFAANFAKAQTGLIVSHLLEEEKTVYNLFYELGFSKRIIGGFDSVIEGAHINFGYYRKVKNRKFTGCFLSMNVYYANPIDRGIFLFGLHGRWQFDLFDGHYIRLSPGIFRSGSYSTNRYASGVSIDGSYSLNKYFDIYMNAIYARIGQGDVDQNSSGNFTIDLGIRTKGKAASISSGVIILGLVVVGMANPNSR